MRFIVRWTRSALSELAAIWTEADSALRQAITAAAHQVDQLLQSHPQEEGESRDAGQRVLFVFPLAIRYEVDAQQGIVRVLRVRSFRQRG